MPAIKQVSFTSPYDAEQADIERRMQLAQLLQQKGQEGFGPTEQIGGWAIKKSPWEALGKSAQQASGAYQVKQGEERQKALGERYQSDLARTLMQAQQAGTGSPAVPSTMYEDASGNAAPTDARAAVAPDRQAMIRALMGHPATQQMGMTQMGNDMQRQAFMAAAGMGQPQQGAGAPQGGAPAGPGAMPQGQPSGFGGPAGGQPMAQWLQLDPTGKAYTEQLAKDFAERGKPVVNRGYGIGTMNAQGQYVADPASVAQAEQVEKMKAGIHAGYAPPVSIPMSGGQSASVFPTEFAGVRQTGKPPQRGMPVSEPTPDERAAMAKLPPLSRGGGSVQVTPGMANNPGTLGLTQPQEDVIRQQRETAAGKEVDQAFGKDYVAFSTGGAQDAAKQIAQLGDVVKQLGTPGTKLTGPFIGGTPDALLKFNKTGQNAIAMRERVEEVVQRSLRAILGAQFTEKEGERLIARAYNPNLSEKENAIRVGRLATQLQQAYASKQDAAQYFEKNNTLQGWKGKMPSMADFDPDTQKASGSIGKPQVSDATKAFLKSQGIAVD